MFDTRETGVAAIHRWKAGRTTFRRQSGGFSEGATFAEDLALFERQVRDEAGLEARTPAALARSGPPASTAA